jgi:hypothetical protein
VNPRPSGADAATASAARARAATAGAATARAATAGEETAASGATAGPTDRDLLEKELEDAAYYLRRNCAPCAERHFQLARRLGATAGEIAVARSRGAMRE